MLSKYLDGLNNSSKIIFVTGGTKSGKSEFAEFLLKNLSDVTYVALSNKRENDHNWQQKILMHRKRRSKSWRLIETIDLLKVLSSESGPLLIDSIGGFIMENIESENKLWLNKMNLLLKALQNRKSLNSKFFSCPFVTPRTALFIKLLYVPHIKELFLSLFLGDISNSFFSLIFEENIFSLKINF